MVWLKPLLMLSGCMYTVCFQLTGSWYISYQINKQEDNKNLCAIYDIQIANSGNITYDMYTRVSPGIVMKTPAQAKIPNKDKPAILSVSYNFRKQFCDFL